MTGAARPTTPWWSPRVHADRRPMLLARNRIKSAIRVWFEANGFIEVETNCLQVSPGNETHLHAFPTELIGTDLRSTRLYLHTSPEFACKKLLAAGEGKMFTFAPVFRNRERGALHSPEFTMLEWYRAGAPYQALWADCAAILNIAAAVTGGAEWTYRGHACRPADRCDELAVSTAFSMRANIVLPDMFDGALPNRDRFAQSAAITGIRCAADDTWADIFSRVMTQRIEPDLGAERPCILYEYPTCEAALARPTAHDPMVAERFELYACGVELANGFGELHDPAEQRRRFTAAMDEKARVYGERYPIDEDFLAALAEMPAASGCALGFDRLVMLATGAPTVDHIRWTPLAEPGT